MKKQYVEFGNVTMNKILLSFLLLLSIFSNSYAKDKLSYGMKAKKIEKISNVKYENDFCKIIFLPKDSAMKNEFDEYLLFSNNDELIRRLQVTDLSYEEIQQKMEEELQDQSDVRRLYESNYQNIYLEMNGDYNFEQQFKKVIDDYYENFPSPNSFPVQILLESKPCDVFYYYEVPTFTASKDVGIGILNIKNCGLILKQERPFFINERICDAFFNYSESFRAEILSDFYNLVKTKEQDRIDTLIQKKQCTFRLVLGINFR